MNHHPLDDSMCIVKKSCAICEHGAFDIDRMLCRWDGYEIHEYTDVCDNFKVDPWLKGE